jgi:hypothetical protein
MVPIFAMLKLKYCTNHVALYMPRPWKKHSPKKNTGRHPASSEIMQFLLSLTLELLISRPPFLLHKQGWKKEDLILVEPFDVSINDVLLHEETIFVVLFFPLKCWTHKIKQWFQLLWYMFAKLHPWSSETRGLSSFLWGLGSRPGLPWRRRRKSTSVEFFFRLP